MTEGAKHDPDDLISLRRGLPLLSKLSVELSQVTYSLNGAGKIVVDKAPAEGKSKPKSPNLADAVKIRFSAAGRSMAIDKSALRWAAQKERRR